MKPLYFQFPEYVPYIYVIDSGVVFSHHRNNLCPPSVLSIVGWLVRVG